MFPIFQLFIVAALIAGGIIYFGKMKGKEKSIIAGLLACLLLSALVANAVLSKVPLPTDEVVVTATGEKTKNAKRDEVYLTNYVVGGKEYAIKNPTEGKWFWKGDAYMWRNESDLRRPEGTTRSITLGIPYGKDRSIQFGLSEWNGIVEVTYGGESQRYDLFKSGSETSLLAPVPDTDSFALYGTKLLRLVLFALMTVALTAFPVLCAVKYEDEVIKKVWWKNWDKIYYLGLAAAYVFLLQKQSVGGSMWYDEIWVLGGLVDPNFSYEESKVLSLIARVWYNIVPYGQEYLRLLSQLFVAGSIYFAGCAGKEFRGKRFGILLSSSVAFSLTIANQCAKGIRLYAFSLFLSTVLLYLYIKARKRNGTSSMVLFGCVSALAMEVHEYAFMAVGLLLFSDFILIVLKKIPKKYWLEFVFPCAYGMYWLTGRFGAHSAGVRTSYAGEPTLSNLLDCVEWLFSYDTFMLLFAATGSVMAVVIYITKIMRHQFNFDQDFTSLTLVSVPILSIAAVYLYSRYICGPGKSIMVDRYFMAFIIFLLFVLCYSLDCVIFSIDELFQSNNAEKCLVVFILFYLCLNCWPEITPWDTWPAGDRTQNNNYKGAVDYVLGQNEIYAPSTLFIWDHPVQVADVGITYYTTHKGERDDINHCSVAYLPEDMEQYETLYVSYVFDRDKVNDALNELIEEQYELAGDNTGARVRKYVKNE